MTTTVPTTVALYRCIAYRNGELTTVSGLYGLLEHEMPEPSAYVWSECWTLCPHGAEEATDENTITVDAADFEEQVFPKSYGQRLEMERWMDWAEEDREREEARG